MYNLRNESKRFELKYGCFFLDDNESESDTQDQQPTEATDDSKDSISCDMILQCSLTNLLGIDPSQPQIATTNIINSFHSQPTAEQEINTLSSVLETDPLEESFSSIVSDAETIQIAVRHERQTLEYSRSLCVPYTDVDDEENGILTNMFTMNSREMSL